MYYPIDLNSQADDGYAEAFLKWKLLDVCEYLLLPYFALNSLLQGMAQQIFMDIPLKKNSTRWI